MSTAISTVNVSVRLPTSTYNKMVEFGRAAGFVKKTVPDVNASGTASWIIEQFLQEYERDNGTSEVVIRETESV